MTRTRSAQSLPGPGDWPLVGRSPELSALRATREDGRRTSAVVIGAAGVGKSRLAREALAAARAQGAHVEWVQATASAATVPLGALAEIVPDETRSDDVVAMMRRCTARLIERAGGRPVVLGVDDAQLLDPASAAMVLHLANARAAFVLATIRAGEPCPDAIVSLWKDGGATRVELAELADEDVRALIEAILGGPVEHAGAQWVIDASGGNALYVRELVRGAVESGALRQTGELWTMVRRPRASASLVELVTARMADLDESERDTVELLALGEPLAYAEAAELGSERALLSAERRGLVSAAPDGVRLVHPLYGEAVRASLPGLRARAVRVRLIGVLEARRPFGPEEALRVARLRLDAGVALPGELTLEAAHAANRAGDPELGGQLAELALADEGGLPAAIALAQAQRLAGQPASAAATLEAAEPLARGDLSARNYVRQRLGLLFWQMRRPAEARELLERIAAWSEDDGWQRFVTRIRHTYAGLIDGVGGLDAAEPLVSGDHVPELPRRLGEVLRRLGLVFAGEGDAAVERSFADAPDTPPYDEADIAGLATLVFAALEAGHRWGDLETYLARTMGDGVRLRIREVAGLSALGIARLHLMRGRYRDADRWLAESEIQLLHADPYNTMVLVRATAVGIACFSRDFDRTLAAQECLESWIADHAPIPAQRPAVAHAAGWAEWARSPAAAGRQLLADAERFVPAMPGLAAALAYDALRAGNNAAIGLLEELGERCHARLVSAYADHARARAANDGPGLLAAAEQMAGIGALRYAVEAASEAASTFVAGGRSDSARRAAARARELHIPDQGASLPVIDGLEATAVELTPRQVQLIDLARQGLSNAEIADRLVISIRTVETHLYRGMQKLGIRDRHDL